MLSKQEVFNKVKTHLLTQNRRAKNVNSSGCRYRAEGGLKCAVGCLIEDQYYDESYETLGVHLVTEKELTTYLEPLVAKLNVALLSSGVDPRNMGTLLPDLQEAHDNFTPETWPSQLKTIAARHNLKYE